MLKEINLSDRNATTEFVNLLSGGEKTIKTEVVAELCDATGKVLFTDTGGNETLIGGALDIAYDMSGLTIPIAITELTEELGFPVQASTEHRNLFGIGISVDGSFVKGTVVPVDKHGKGYNLTYLVPFLTVALEEDDPATHMQKYAIRHVDGTTVKYYVKKFEEQHLYARTQSGLDLNDNPDTAVISEDVEAILEYKVTLEIEEAREFFITNDGDINARRISAVTLFKGKRHDLDIDGSTYDEYTNVIGSNRRNFETIDMGSDTSLNIIYRLTIK